MSAPPPLSKERISGPIGAMIRLLSGFVSLSADERTRLVDLVAHVRPEASRTELAGEGEEMDAAFVVLEGVACRYRTHVDGRRQVLAYLLPGDLCDLDLGLIGRLDYAVTTLTACLVAHIPRDALIDLHDHYPGLIRALRLAKLAQEVRYRDWVMKFGCGSATERVAHLFCEVLERLAAVGLATEDGCDLPITQIDLADTVGLSPVHLNRTLQVLRGDGLIEFKGGKLRVPDVSRLRLLAGFKPHDARRDGDIGGPVPDGPQPTIFRSRPTDGEHPGS